MLLPSPPQVVLDPEYRKLSRQRHQAAAAKTRTVQYLQDTKLVGAPTTVQVRSARSRATIARAGQLSGRPGSAGFAVAASNQLSCYALQALTFGTDHHHSPPPPFLALLQIGQKRKEVSEKRDRMDARELTAILFRCGAGCAFAGTA